MSAGQFTTADFSDAGAAADHARDATVEARDFALVVSLALSTEGGHLTIEAQEAVRTAALHVVAKLGEARDAIDLAGVMLRTRERRG